jgi:hypothetical protein
LKVSMFLINSDVNKMVFLYLIWKYIVNIFLLFYCRYSSWGYIVQSQNLKYKFDFFPSVQSNFCCMS